MKTLVVRTAWLVLGLVAAAAGGGARLDAKGASATPAPEKSAAAKTVPAPAGWRLSWDEGVRLSAPDNVTTFKLGGLFTGDLADADDSGPALGDDSAWRMIRPCITGRLSKDVDFRVEADFVNPQVRLTDVFLRMSNLPWVRQVRVGHIKEPLFLDQVTGSAAVTFPEPALPYALVPARGFGVILGGPAADERTTWYAGLFRNTAQFASRSTDGGEAWAISGRVTALPLYSDGGRTLLHLGASGSLRFPSEPIRFGSRPEAFLASKITDTKTIDADAVQLVGGEAAFVCGPFVATSEYFAARVDRSSASSLWLDGFYVEAGWFLTGESRPYDRKGGTWGPVRPKRSVLDGGPGAWELAARYSALDLTGPGLTSSARRLRDVTVGVNWYLTSNLRLAFDWVHSDADPPTRDGGLFVVRLQASF